MREDSQEEGDDKEDEESSVAQRISNDSGDTDQVIESNLDNLRRLKKATSIENNLLHKRRPTQESAEEQQAVLSNFSIFQKQEVTEKEKNKMLNRILQSTQYLEKQLGLAKSAATRPQSEARQESRQPSATLSRQTIYKGLKTLREDGSLNEEFLTENFGEKRREMAVSEGFGELALLADSQKNARRTATIIAQEKLITLVVLRK